LNTRTSRFTARVLAAVRRIPTGRVATYGDIAASAGQPRAWRAVGNIMKNCSARDVPCHRVIAAGGKLGGYGGNTAMKRALLQAEGVLVPGDRIKDYRSRRWTGRPAGGPKGPKPARTTGQRTS
jgi:O-6-methylguanine DNA methyltransferase